MIQPKTLSPDTPIPGIPDTTITDFWAWAYSDVLSNRNRSIFAEFLVAKALGITGTPRIEWDAVDLRYRGNTIEVKSAAYLQSWKQAKLSQIRFDIAPKIGWNAATNSYPEKPTRSADIYVFCLYVDTDPATADVLDVSRWKFYVLPTRLLDERFGEQKSVALSRLNEHCSPVSFKEISTTPIFKS